MGLSAGQARLLTITARKSDCEFESMRLSHQKIALARDLADLSNEYQNSLTQTKLVYDYYGTGSTDTPLSYGLLMQPSALNNYMPTLITDSLGRVALNSQYARAAEAAGIPQEGLGSLPSEDVRNKFISKLADNGLVSNVVADKILSLPYNQAAGLGGDVTVAVQTKEVTLSELAEELQNYASSPLTFNVKLNSVMQSTGKICLRNGNTNVITTTKGESDNTSVTLGDVLNGDYLLYAQTGNCGQSTGAFATTGGVIDAILNTTFWDDMFDTLDSMLDTGDYYTQMALEYAKSEVGKLLDDPRYDENGAPYGDGWYLKDKASDDSDWKWSSFDILKKNPTVITETGLKQNNDAVNSNVINHVKATGSGASGIIGMYAYGNTDTGDDDHNDCRSTLGINLSSIMKAYLTYFADYMNGVSKLDSNGNQVYDVGKSITASHLVKPTTKFTIKTGTDISSDELATATFYDALFNQICVNGWIENDELTDNNYLKEMLQSGKLFISSVTDDHYYYQGNYSTNKYVKEVSDDTLIAYAESKYNTEKAKLNAKEQTLDLKMKNLDTEISSLTTEYDTVKNTITKNVEKSFKRYSA